jgi:hypothetical protein
MVKQFSKIVENDKIITSIYRCVAAKQNGECMVGIVSGNKITIVFLEFRSKSRTTSTNYYPFQNRKRVSVF